MKSIITVVHVIAGTVMHTRQTMHVSGKHACDHAVSLPVTLYVRQAANMTSYHTIYLYAIPQASIDMANATVTLCKHLTFLPHYAPCHYPLFQLLVALNATLFQLDLISLSTQTFYDTCIILLLALNPN